MEVLRERRTSFSLKYRAIRPSTVFGTRRKVALHGSHIYAKTIFDATKVTYNIYSYAISGMSREMMKIEGRDSAEYQNWEKKHLMVILN